MAASDWAEIQALQAALARTQLSSTSHRLSERNCVELVTKLVEKGLIEVIHTCDGREYLTAKQLEREIRDELIVQGGTSDVLQWKKSKQKKKKKIRTTQINCKIVLFCWHQDGSISWTCSRWGLSCLLTSWHPFLGWLVRLLCSALHHAPAHITVKMCNEQTRMHAAISYFASMFNFKCQFNGIIQLGNTCGRVLSFHRRHLIFQCTSFNIFVFMAIFSCSLKIFMSYWERIQTSSRKGKKRTRI